MFVPEKEAAGGSLFQTDVRRRTNLSTATNALRSAAAETHDDFLGSSSEERLAEMEDELNRIVDRDVETLVEGMEEIIDLSSVGSVDKLRALQDSLAIELRTETLVRSCTSLMALSHSMKMLWLLGDEANGRRIQEAQISSLNSEIAQLKARAAQLIEELKMGIGTSPDPSDHEMNLDPTSPSSNAQPSSN